MQLFNQHATFCITWTQDTRWGLYRTTIWLFFTVDVWMSDICTNIEGMPPQVGCEIKAECKLCDPGSKKVIRDMWNLMRVLYSRNSDTEQGQKKIASIQAKWCAEKDEQSKNSYHQEVHEIQLNRQMTMLDKRPALLSKEGKEDKYVYNWGLSWITLSYMFW